MWSIITRLLVVVTAPTLLAGSFGTGDRAYKDVLHCLFIHW